MSVSVNNRTLNLILATSALLSIVCSSFMTDPGKNEPRIMGLVTDEDSVRLAGVRVTSFDGELSCVTDKDGRFFLDSLDPGTYDLRFTLQGFETETVEDIEVSEDDPGAKYWVVLKNPTIARSVSGGFNYRFPTIGAVYTELTGDNIDAAHPRRSVMTFDSESNSYSGTIRQPVDGSSWKLKVVVYDYDSSVVGETDREINNSSSSIKVPDFLPVNKIVILYDDSTSAGEYLRLTELKQSREYALITRHSIRAIDTNGTVLTTLRADEIAAVTGKGGIYTSATCDNGDILVGGALDSTIGANMFIARISPELSVAWSRVFTYSSSIAWPNDMQERDDTTINVNVHLSDGGLSKGLLILGNDGTTRSSTSTVGRSSTDGLSFYDKRTDFVWSFPPVMDSTLLYYVRLSNLKTFTLSTTWTGESAFITGIDTWGDSSIVFFAREQQSTESYIVALTPISMQRIFGYQDELVPVCRTSPTSYLVARRMDFTESGLGVTLVLENIQLDNFSHTIDERGIVCFPEVPLTMLKVRDEQYLGAGRTTAFSGDGHLQTYVLRMHETEIIVETTVETTVM